ncbi:MerR family DNA-binding protein [Nonomuraea recticatena]|uniref:Helix-turn-helix domain-containing protein n=1 Tax=Nonomuraea recticatena TaxID=46178 RepID=A0ABN3RWJ3_9ACTN
MLLDIGEVAQRSGLAASALRFYERKGLISPVGRNGIRRAYEPETLSRLALIACARRAGFTLTEIATLLHARPSDAALRERVAQKADELDGRIAQLTRMRDSLRHAASCTHDPLVSCPEFKQVVRGETPDPAS